MSGHINSKQKRNLGTPMTMELYTWFPWAAYVAMAVTAAFYIHMTWHGVTKTKRVEHSRRGVTFGPL